MEIEYKGGNCVLITAKKTVVAVDPHISMLGLKDQGSKAVVQLATKDEFALPDSAALLISGPGEYEVENISIKGVPVQAHMDPKTAPLHATMYRLSTAEITVAVIGHIHPELNEEQLEGLGLIDVLVIPVGGNGYTLDATGAIQVIKEINPKLVVPTHYSDPDVKYPVPQAELEGFLKELGAPQDTSSKLKLKAGAFADTLSVHILTRTA